MNTSRRDSDSGYSLVEVLVAVMIIGLAFTAILGAMATSILGSDLHHRQATAGTLLVSAIESIEKQDYVRCDTGPHPAQGPYQADLGPSDADVADLPVGWSPPELVHVRVWDGTSFVPWWSASSGYGGCDIDGELQHIEVKAPSPEGRAVERMSFVKRAPG